VENREALSRFPHIFGSSFRRPTLIGRGKRLPGLLKGHKGGKRRPAEPGGKPAKNAPFLDTRNLGVTRKGGSLARLKRRALASGGGGKVPVPTHLGASPL